MFSTCQYVEGVCAFQAAHAAFSRWPNQPFHCVDESVTQDSLSSVRHTMTTYGGLSPLIVIFFYLSSPEKYTLVLVDFCIQFQSLFFLFLIIVRDLFRKILFVFNLVIQLQPFYFYFLKKLTRVNIYFWTILFFDFIV